MGTASYVPAQLTSFHSSVFHFLTLTIILLALTGGRFSKTNTANGCSIEAARNSSIKSIHVMRQETLADGTQSKDLLLVRLH